MKPGIDGQIKILSALLQSTVGKIKLGKCFPLSTELSSLLTKVCYFWTESGDCSHRIRGFDLALVIYLCSKHPLLTTT